MTKSPARCCAALVLLMLLGGCASRKQAAAWLAAKCAEPVPGSSAFHPTEESLASLPPQTRCRIDLLLRRGTRQDLEMAPCYMQGKTVERCRQEAINGIAVGESFYECPWSPPAGWEECGGGLQQEQLRQATRHYADLVAAMDGPAIANLFTPDGEVTVVGQPPVQGRKAILDQLESFKGFKVLSEMLTADTVAVEGDSGHVTGTYRQRVRVPAGDILEVHGLYEADWLRDSQGAWHIRRMMTTPQTGPNHEEGVDPKRRRDA